MIDSESRFPYEKIGNVKRVQPFELRRLKTNNTALIVGNGPSAISYFDGSLGIDADIFSFSYSALVNSHPGFYYYEPLFIKHPEWEDWQGNLNYHFSTFSLLHICSQRIANKEFNSNVIINPQIPPNNYGLHCNLGKKITSYSLPYFYVHESDDYAIIRSLREFKKVARLSPINYAGSMIRAISLAYCLEYERIIIVGQEPSTNKCWYDLQEALPLIKQYAGEYAVQLIEFATDIKNKYGENKNIHTGERTKNTLGSISAATFLTIKVLNMIAGKKSPEIIHLNQSDKLIKEHIETFQVKCHSQI